MFFVDVSALGFRPSGLGFDGYFCFSTSGFFFHVTALGLRPSGLAFMDFFLFF